MFFADVHCMKCRIRWENTNFDDMGTELKLSKKCDVWVVFLLFPTAILKLTIRSTSQLSTIRNLF